MGTTTIASGDTYTVGQSLSLPITPANGGTGIANNNASTLAISGNFATTITVSGITAVTLPTSGTLTTLATVLSTASTYTAGQRNAITTLTYASTITADFSLSNNFFVVLTGNATLDTPTNLVAGQSGWISVYQDITGSRTLAFSWAWQFAGGTAPTLTTGKVAFDQLYYAVNKSSTSTVTVTIANPAVMTWTAHGLSSGDRIQLSTTGALPTGLTTATTYWVTVVNANTFKLSSSLANIQAAIFITTTGSQSGVHTAINASITLSSNLAIQ